MQLHHIDDDRSNADPDNFAVLCVDCHNETLRTGGFGRRLNAAQIRRYRDDWIAAVAERLRMASRESSEGHVVIGAPPSRADDVVDRLLAEADRSPKVGLSLLAAELEQEVRRLLAGSGWGEGRHDWKLRDAIARLFELGVVSNSVHVSLDVFERTRVAIAAGTPPVDVDEALRAVDVGITTYRALAAIPRERHYVLQAQIPVLTDEAGNEEISDIWGVGVRSAGPPPRKPHDAVFLTRRSDFAWIHRAGRPVLSGAATRMTS